MGEQALIKQIVSLIPSLAYTNQPKDEVTMPGKQDQDIAL